MTEQLVRSIDSAQGLLEQLQELRKNLTATAEQQQQQQVTLWKGGWMQG